MVEKLISKYFVLLILLFSLPAVWALFVPGYYGASDDLHIAWLSEMDKLIKLGQIPPRYVPDLSFGFGYPLFNFVYPLPFYIGEVFHLVGFSLVDSIKAVFLISVPLSGIGMFLLLKELNIKISWAFLGALIYIYTPYRATDLYVRGAIGEVMSFIFLPLLVLALIKILRTKEGINWLFVSIGGLTFSLLILSHNITTYMFLPFLALLSLIVILVDREQLLNKLIGLVMLGLLGLSISSYFWLPALIDSNLLKYDTVFNFVDHFPTLKQLVTPFWGYGASVPGPYDGMSFFLGIMPLIILIGSILLIIFKWRKIAFFDRAIIIWVYLSLIIAMFMMNFRSAFFWSNLPLLPYFQFPWRFLTMTTFLIPVLVISFQNLKWRWLPYLFCLILLATTVYMFRPQDFLGRTDQYFLKKYIPSPIVDSEYLKQQEEYLRLPKDLEKRPDQLYSRVFPMNPSIKVMEQSDLDASIKTATTTALRLNYNKYNFPGWFAKIDGRQVPIYSGKPFSQVTVNVPGGMHVVDIYFKETNFKRVLDWISLASFWGAIWLILVSQKKVKSEIINK